MFDGYVPDLTRFSIGIDFKGLSQTFRGVGEDYSGVIFIAEKLHLEFE